ncbi:hypothetical protein ACP70R_020701 [Stipagrostis hirtigluma subsp. patula]
MWRAKPLPLTILLTLALALSSWPCALASDNNGGRPLVTPITKDASTSLYTIPIKDSHLPLVLDLAGPLIWSCCEASHPTFELYDCECTEAGRHTPARCWSNAGNQGQPEHSGKSFADNRCVAHRYDPATGKCAAGDLSRTQLSANATDGRTPLYPVSFSAVSACSPDTLRASLPAGAAGVAGLSRSELALPAQVASTQNVAKTFALCLSSGQGAAIFGGGPFFLLPPWLPDMAPAPSVPLQRSSDLSDGYYIKAKGISVNQQQVPLNGNEFIVELSTTAPYTALRHDVYHALVHAYGQATSGIARITPAPAPFELCYDVQQLSVTRVGYGVPPIVLELEGGATWIMFGANSLVQVNDQAACLAFVEMKKEAADGPTPAIVMGGHQLEDNLLVFDLEKGKLGFSGLLLGRQTHCGNFNFTGTA